MWQCPVCKSTELDVEVSVTVQLVQRGDDPENFETEYNGGDHLWDGGNLMTCRDCGHCDASNAFAVPAPIDIEEMVSQVTPENRHDPVDWGPDYVREILNKLR